MPLALRDQGAHRARKGIRYRISMTHTHTHLLTFFKESGNVEWIQLELGYQVGKAIQSEGKNKLEGDFSLCMWKHQGHHMAGV